VTLSELANEIGHLPEHLGVLILAEVDRMSSPRQAGTGDLRRLEEPILLPPPENTTRRRCVESFAWSAHTAIRRFGSDTDRRKPAS
jgi:hypothetical protein